MLRQLITLCCAGVLLTGESQPPAPLPGIADLRPGTGDRLMDQVDLVQDMRAHQDRVDAAVAQIKAGKLDSELLNAVAHITAQVEQVQRERRSIQRGTTKRQLTDAEILERQELADRERFGQIGVVYLAWSFKDPNARDLPTVLTRLRDERPDIPIIITHVASLSTWEDVLVDNQEIDRAVRSGTTDSLLIQRLADRLHRNLEPVTGMAAFEGRSGVPLFADVRVQIAQRIDATTTWTYITPSGVQHRLVGAGPNLRLATWIAHIDAWETRRMAEYAAKDIPKEAFRSTVAKDIRTIARQ